MSAIAWPETNGVVRETAVMSEDVMSRDELSALVRDSVLRAVHGGRVQSASTHDSGDSIVVGAGARAVIEHSVVAAIKDLLGRQALLSGPLRELAERLESARADAVELRAQLREFDSMLAQAKIKPVVLAPAQPVATDPAKSTESVKMLPAVVAPAKPVVLEQPCRTQQKRCARCKSELTKTNRSLRSPSYCVKCLVPSPTEIVVEVRSLKAFKDEKPSETQQAETKQPKRTQPKPEWSSTDDGLLEPIMVNGIRIEFNKRSQPAFIRIFREFVDELKKAPVNGRDAFVKAQSYGFTGNTGTFLANIENRLGKLDKDEGMWSLAGWTGTA